MRQAIHIFKKDVRALRGEIVLLLALAALLGWAETHLAGAAGVAELLVVLVINYAIARVIHAEAIPGHNQFWITRPYRWKSLLGAKILFVLVFVNLPIFAAQCYMISAEGFMFGASLPGLIWSQMLMILCVSLPVMCLASLTASLIPFLLAEFILVAEVFIGEGLIHVRPTWTALLPAMQPSPDAVDWVRDSVVMTVITAVAGCVLYWQYRKRQTGLDRKYAMGGGALAAVIFLCVPGSFALGVQAELSKQTFDKSSFGVGLASVRRSAFPPRGRDPKTQDEVSLPVAIRGAPAGLELQADALAIVLVGSDGRTWSSGLLTPFAAAGGAAGDTDAAETVIDANLRIAPSFLQSEGMRPVTVRAKLYITLFGNPHSVTIPIQPEPVNAIDGLQCSSGFFNQLYCRSIFRWPRRRVYAKTGDNGLESYIRSVSYSPFPATLGFNPIEEHSFSATPTATRATVTTKEPLSHFEVEREIPGVSLAEFTAAAKRRALTVRPPGVPVE